MFLSWRDNKPRVLGIVIGAVAGLVAITPAAPVSFYIFVYPVDDVICIRTGERGHDALLYEGDIDTRIEVELAVAD
jgi:hypothetical protein